MAELVDKAILDDSDYIKSLKRMDTEMGKVFKDANGRLRDAHGRFVAMGKAGEAAFGKVNQAAKQAGAAGSKAGQDTAKGFQTSGVQIGLVSGLVQALTNRIINLGQQAASAFIQFNKEAVGLASELITLPFSSLSKPPG